MKTRISCWAGVWYPKGKEKEGEAPLVLYEIADRLIPGKPGTNGPVAVVMGYAEGEGAGPLPGELDAARLPGPGAAHTTRVAFRDGYVAGSLALASKEHAGQPYRLSFGLWPKGLLLLDDSGLAAQTLDALGGHALWKQPASAARAFSSFLEALVEGDWGFLVQLETDMAALEEEVLADRLERVNERMMALRKRAAELILHYAQLSDMAQQLSDVGEAYFTPGEARAFGAFAGRVSKLLAQAEHLREYSSQIWEAYQAGIDIRQNRVMKLLTVVTTIFMPLTLITGWYGMNFHNMGAINWPYGYPVVCAASVVVALLLLWLCKKKRFL